METSNDNVVELARYSELDDRVPVMVRVGEVDLLVIRYDHQVSVLFGRCPHRGAPLGDAKVEGEYMLCAAHGWDFRYDDGKSRFSAHPDDCLFEFDSWIDPARDVVMAKRSQIEDFYRRHPQAFEPDEYLGA